MTEVRNIVLVHGGFVDGSGWRGVYDALRADGFNVSVVQNQTLSLDSDVETTHNVLDEQDGPSILVGHSYGGVVITEAGRHDNVAGLAYIARSRPRCGRVREHADRRPAARRAGPADPRACSWCSTRGFLFLDREKSRSRSRRICRRTTRSSWPTHRSRGVEALNGEASEPAWRTKPTWYLVATDDRMIPPPAQRAMSERAGATVVEEAGSH